MSLIPYNNIVSRSDSSALIPEEVSRVMLDRARERSAALRLFRRIPVSRNQTRLPIASALPTAFFVNGDTGLKQTTEVNWTNKFLNIEEIAALVPISDAVASDVDGNLWDIIMPDLVEAVERTLDAAIFFGTNAPSTWPTNIADAAAAAGNENTVGNTAANGGFYGDYDETVALLEADGYDPTGVVASRAARASIRAARDTQGQRTDLGRIGGDLSSIDGIPIVYPMRGQFPASSGDPLLFVGEWDRYVIGVREDISVKIFDTGVINDASGNIVYNLLQQDMKVMRLVFRVGWEVANTINYDQPTEGSRYPAATLVRA